MSLSFLLQLAIHQRSIFKKDTKNVVRAQEYDSYEVIKQVEPVPKQLKSISELHLTSTPITEDQYPWPGHKYTTTSALLTQETNAIFSRFGVTNITEDEAYYHPVAMKQFYSSMEEIKNLPRYKIRYLFNPSYMEQHWTALFAPPGEVITIEIPESAIGIAKVTFNTQCYNGNAPQRLPNLLKTFTLDRKVNTICWPYGGQIDIIVKIDTYKYGLEVNISGVIRCPYYRYDLDTEDDFYNNLINLPGPIFVFDTGAFVAYMPTSQTLNTIDRLDDGLRYWRSVGEIMHAITPVTSGYWWRREDGRVRAPLRWNYDSYVAVGVAFALVGANYIQFPISWITYPMNYGMSSFGAWGTSHELGHQFQGDIGIQDVDKDREVTNNLLTVIQNSIQGSIDNTRQPTATGVTIRANDEWLSQRHQSLMLTSDDILNFYISFIYSFGTDRAIKFYRANFDRSYYSSGTKLENFFIRACYHFNRDLTDYFKSYGRVFTNPNITQKLKELNLKSYHPMAHVYQTGNVHDGEEFETARPFEIPAHQDYIFDFAKQLVTRSDMPFEFYSIEGGKGKFVELSKGRYLYTPLADIDAIDKFYVNYRDTLNGEIRKTIVRVRQATEGCVYKTWYDISQTNVDDAFAEMESRQPDATTITNKISIPKSGVKHITSMQGMIVPDETTNYTFYMTSYDNGYFYLSETPLTLNRTLDADHLILSHGFRMYYNDGLPSKTVFLTKGQPYYFRYIIHRDGTHGQGTSNVGYRKGEINKSIAVADVKSEWLYIDSAKLGESNYMYVPPFWDITMPFKYYGDREEIVNNWNWNVTAAPKEQNNKPRNYLIDNDASTAFVSGWWPNNNNAKFPNIYDINTTDPATFDRVRFYNKESDYGFRGHVIISCDGEETVFEGLIDVDPTYGAVVDLEKPATCREMIRLNFTDNEKRWSNGGYPGGTRFDEISFIKVTTESEYVLPATSDLVVKDNWRVDKFGFFFNGKGYYGTKGCKMTYTFNGTKDISVLGDKFAGAGKAKVYIDGAEVGEFDASKLTSYENLTYKAEESPKLHKVILFAHRGLEPNTQHTIDIVVEDGEVGISGFLQDNEPVPDPYIPPRPTPIPEPTNKPGQNNENQNNNGDNTAGKSNSTPIIIGVVIAVVVAIVAVVAVILIKRRKQTPIDEEQEKEEENVQLPPNEKFSDDPENDEEAVQV